MVKRPYEPLVVACLAVSAALGSGGPPQAWMQATPGYADKPTAADLNGDGLLEVVIGTDSMKVLALDGSSGAKLYTVDVGDTVIANPLVDDVDGDGTLEIIVTGGRNGAVVCLDGATGQEEWRVPAARDGIGGGALADADGNGRKELYYAQADRLKAVDATSGNRLWEQRTPDGMRGAVAVADIDGGGPEVLVGCDDQSLLCYGADGQFKWAAKVRGAVTKAPLVTDLNNDGQAEIFAVGSSIARIGSSGAVAWQWSPRSGRGLASSLACEDVNGDGSADLVLTGYDGKLYAVSSAGRELWSYVIVAPVGGSVPFIPASTPALIDINGDGGADALLTSPRSDKGALMAVSGKTGRLLWSVPLQGFSQCAPLVADINGDQKAELVATTAMGRVYSFRLARHAARGWCRYGGDLAGGYSLAGARSVGGLLLTGRMPVAVRRQDVPWQGQIGGRPPAGGAQPPPPVTPPTQPSPNPTPPAGGAGRPASDVAVLLNGSWLRLDPAPTMVGGSVLVPLRGIFEAMGAEVKFAAGVITATKGQTVVSLTLGSRAATVNGRPVTLSVPAQSVAGSTFVPLRFIGEAFGASVKWDAAGKNVEIQT